LSLVDLTLESTRTRPLHVLHQKPICRDYVLSVPYSLSRFGNAQAHPLAMSPEVPTALLSTISHLFQALFQKCVFKGALACALRSSRLQETSSTMDSLPTLSKHVFLGGLRVNPSASDPLKQTRGKRRRCGFIADSREYFYLRNGMRFDRHQTRGLSSMPAS